MWIPFIFKFVVFTLTVTVIVTVSTDNSLCNSCSCVDTHIFCVGSFDLSLLFTYDGSKVTSLIIVDVQEGTLTGDNFVKFPNVLDLQMDSNNVVIDPDVFSSLTKLINLDLRNNSIQVIFEAMFRENTNVKNLDLSLNRIEEINNGIFSHLKRLITLNLGSNKISVIESKAFAGLEDLRELDLSNNHLGRVRPFLLSPLRGLQHLLLRGNRLERLEAWPLAALQELDVRGNALLRVEASALEPLRGLRELRAGANQVASLSRDLVALLAARPGLRAQLAPNPLRCACDARELRDAWAEAAARGLRLDCACDSGLPWGLALDALRCGDGDTDGNGDDDSVTVTVGFVEGRNDSSVGTNERENLAFTETIADTVSTRSSNSQTTIIMHTSSALTEGPRPTPNINASATEYTSVSFRAAQANSSFVNESSVESVNEITESALTMDEKTLEFWLVLLLCFVTIAATIACVAISVLYLEMRKSSVLTPISDVRLRLISANSASSESSSCCNCV